MKTHITIILITAAVFAGIIFLIVDYHRATEDEVTRRFHDHQTMMVGQLVREINQYLLARSQGVRVVSTLASLQHRDMKTMPADIQEYFQYVKQRYVKAISMYDEKGTIVYSTTEDAIGRNYAECDFFQWATQKKNKGKEFVSSLIRASENRTKPVSYFRFIIATPVYQKTRDSRTPKPPDKFVGVLTITIDLEEVIAAFLPSFTTNDNEQHVWIVDTSGTVLFQSAHPEMVLRNIFRRDESCTHCHASFNHVEKVLAEKQGTVEYALREQPKKSAAFALLTFKNVAWIIVVNVPLDKVSGFLARQLTETFLLIAVILVALIGASTLIYRNNRSKVRAEEEAKQWREKRELEDRIRESEERYRTMVETAHDVVWTLDAQGNLTYINKRGEEISGYKMSDLIGKKYSLKVLEEDLPKVQDAVIQTLQGKPQSFEARIYDSHGKNVFLSVNQVPLYQSGNVIGTVSFGRDITESKRAEEVLQATEKRFRALIEKSSDVISLLAADGTILYESPAAMRILGYAAEELKGRNAFELVHPDDLQGTSALFVQLVQTPGASVQAPFRFRHKDGSWRSLDVIGTNMLSDPIIQAVIINYRDITERRRAEEELHRRNQELSVLHTIDRAVNQTLDLDEILNVALEKTMEVLEADAGGIYLIQEDGKTMFFVVHRGLSEEFVKNVERIQLGEGISGRAAAERKPVIMDISQYPSSRLAPFIVKEGMQSLASVPLLAKDRALGAINVGSRKPNAFPENKMQTLLSIGIQIGVAVQNAEFFKAEQRKTTQLFAINTISQNIAAFMDVEKLFSRVVQLIQETFGFAYVTLAVVDEKANEIVYTVAAGYDVAELKEPHQKLGAVGIIPSVALSGQALLTNDVSTEPRFEHCDVLKDTRSELAVPIMMRNKVVAVLDIQSEELNAFSPDDLTTFKTVAGDVGIAIENARLYEDLRGTTNYLENLITYANAPIIVWNSEREVTLFNRAFEKLSGYRSDEVIGCDLEILFPAAEKEEILKTINQAIKGERWETVEIPIQRNDGERRIALWNSASIVDNEGKIIATIAQGQDITERKRAEEELLISQTTYEGIINSITETIYIQDENGAFLNVNLAAEKMYGYPREYFVGRTPEFLSAPGKNNLAEIAEYVRQAFHGQSVTFEFWGLRKDGTVFPKDVSVTPGTYFGKKVVIAVARDITERKLAEDTNKSLEVQLQQAQRLESLGTLAGGIAHDFNNILGIIMGHSALLERLKADPQNLSQSIDAITKATQRGASLVKQLLTFARKSEAIFQTVRINNIISEIKALLRETLPKTITISTSLQQDLPAIVADASQIHQVLLNLCVNARDAMPKHGTLSISTDTVEGESVSSRFPKATARQYVRIEVTDTGIGMDESTRQRIFEPFFTTKGPGKGTGLGLAVVFGIIEKHNGFVDVRSAPGEGTSFTMYLPIPERALEELQPARKGVEEIAGGTETILLIEDEEMLRELARAFLVSKGYTVLTAQDGEEGVEAFSRHQKEISVVVTDMGLPKLGGEEVFKRIRALDPKVKVILASGFIDPEVKSEMYKAGVKHFIQKPYSRDDVLQKVREVIDTKQ